MQKGWKWRIQTHFHGRVVVKLLRAQGLRNERICKTRPMTNTDYKNIDAAAFGRQLRGFGINLLVREVPRCCRFLEQVCLFETVRESEDYAILRNGEQIIQLHSDQTYHSHPLPSLLPENGPRGGGMELHLFELDPDQAEQRAEQAGYTVLQPCTNKPHGLRECYLLDPDGYCWVPSRPLTDNEK